MTELLKTPSASDAHTEGMTKINQKFGDSGSLAQEMETGFIFNRKPWTLSAEGSPASLFPTLESERVRETTVFSGRKCYELYARFARLGSLAKMLLESSIWHSNKCVLTWKAKVMKSNRLLFQLAVSTPPIAEIGSGFLHTPRTMEVEESQEKFVNRMGDRTMACTSGLSMQIAMFPINKLLRDGKDPGLKLQPAFVEWMMGFPIGWIDSNPLETP